MTRPSRNVDQLLLQAGHALLPETGVRGLGVRQVAERAGVNPGMFHYHFKTKDTFVRALLQQKYNDMFATLELEAHKSASTVENLRAAVGVLVRFGRDNRVFLVRLLGDAFAGEVVVMEFLQANMPRHIAVIVALVMQGQAEGLFRKIPPPQAIAFLIGGIAAPILLGTAVLNSGLAPQALSAQLEQMVFSDAAIAERIDMALAGLASPSSGVRK